MPCADGGSIRGAVCPDRAEDVQRPEATLGEPVSDRMYDLFISHAWRYHDDWTRMGELLDGCPGLKWRNFSVPWYDPAMDPNTEVGGRFVHRWLEQQIVPACGVILLSSVWANKSARKWVELELDLARKHGKPVVAVPPFGEAEVPADAAARADAVCGWEPHDIVKAFDARIAAQHGAGS